MCQPPSPPLHARSVGKPVKEKRRGGDAEGGKAAANGGGKPSGAGGKPAKPGKGPSPMDKSVFAEFDRAYAAIAAREKEVKPAAAAPTVAGAGGRLDGNYVGGFAGLKIEGEAPPAARPAARGGSSSDGEGSATAGAPAAAKKAAKPKAPKKPRVTVAQVAAGLDAGAVQELVASLQQRYAGAESSQVEVMADSIAKMFREAQVRG